MGQGQLDAHYLGRAQASSIRSRHHFGPKLGLPSAQQWDKNNLGYLGRSQAWGTRTWATTCHGGPIMGQGQLDAHYLGRAQASSIRSRHHFWLKLGLPSVQQWDKKQPRLFGPISGLGHQNLGATCHGGPIMGHRLLDAHYLGPVQASNLSSSLQAPFWAKTWATICQSGTKTNRCLFGPSSRLPLKHKV